MSLSSVRIVSGGILAASLGLISCSTAPSSAGGASAELWAAAAKTYSAGDYAKAADHLERLISDRSPYSARAIPWCLVVTSGMARGYMDLADRYAAGARFNKARALTFRLRATKYRTMASEYALRFAQLSDRLSEIPLGSVPLAFTFPRGNGAAPALFSRIGAGIEITPAEQEAAETLAVERGVLMAVCLAAGAPNDVAKSREILTQGSPGNSRAAFGDAIAQMLDSESALFQRDALNEPDKGAILRERAERVRVEAARVVSARIGLVVSAAPGQ
jgi:hypothetical protein